MRATEKQAWGFVFAYLSEKYAAPEDGAAQLSTEAR